MDNNMTMKEVAAEVKAQECKVEEKETPNTIYYRDIL